MNPDLRTAGVIAPRRAKATHRCALNLLLSLVVFVTAACSERAPPAASANGHPQPHLPAPGPALHTAPENLSQVAAGQPAAGLTASADETVLEQIAGSSADKTRVFLHGLHSPFGMAQAMSRMPTPR